MDKGEIRLSEKNSQLDSAKDTVKEIVRDVYQDGAKPVIKATGELAALIPRAIKAMLAPFEKWIVKREYNMEETSKLLEEKLKNVPPEQIESPEPYIAVPAIQCISYCMDNAILRDMYANLLANSMNKVVKNGVHPGFVEIIKQLCPDEAKILRYMAKHNVIPTITLRYVCNKCSGIDVIRNFSTVGELAKCEEPLEVNKYFDNLIRLGLLEMPGRGGSFTNKKLYLPLEEHSYILSFKDEEKIKMLGYKKYQILRGLVWMTDFGKEFCNICITE